MEIAVIAADLPLVLDIDEMWRNPMHHIWDPLVLGTAAEDDTAAAAIEKEMKAVRQGGVGGRVPLGASGVWGSALGCLEGGSVLFFPPLAAHTSLCCPARRH